MDELLFWKNAPITFGCFNELFNNLPNTSRRLPVPYTRGYDTDSGYFLVVSNDDEKDPAKKYSTLYFSSRRDRNCAYNLGYTNTVPTEDQVVARYAFLQEIAMDELIERSEGRARKEPEAELDEIAPDDVSAIARRKLVTS